MKKIKIIGACIVLVTLLVLTALFSARGGAGLGADAVLKIAAVHFNGDLYSNAISIVADHISCSVFSNGKELSDRIVLEYVDDSNKLLQSDTVFINKNENGVFILDTKIPVFQKPVVVKITRSN